MSKAAPESARGTIGIIGAMSQETELLCAELQHSDEREVMGFSFLCRAA